MDIQQPTGMESSARTRCLFLLGVMVLIGNIGGHRHKNKFCGTALSNMLECVCKGKGYYNETNQRGNSLIFLMQSREIAHSTLQWVNYIFFNLINCICHGKNIFFFYLTNSYENLIMKAY